MDRRDFISAGFAAFGAALAAGSAAAQATAGAVPSDTVLPARLQPALVRLRAPLPPGEVHVFPNHFQLYWTLPDGQAWRYGIRVGRDRLYESGTYYVGAKKEWPSWTPTPDMIAREPERYKKWEDGMPGGPNNPLGARALYLFEPGRGDTYLRIHGTADTWTIGRAVSNGCAGLTNEHIKLLYAQVPMNARVVLYPKMGPEPVPLQS
ncbi:ErfK/YbiS/YcfS/YnhG family protein/Tat domain protein [Oceaniovalibus guishaninsula JLT2003]|uniref:ErfK/YbiS/YcfS/YnhG family protein/Tat domain protein n=1 Tax=Oceaniovalibus guishaninsula JLT2003 TaxID=1231392 RepID=K2GNM9_9RHOB|nr:L,D-transpeptidase [Oceaniovalibus guishaninsula]EKE44256.1 ErfK/YbiS/YcfS/YnhG family protein/Tat domain protein [Oceaniovalibus guishaninsula JLT2003]